MTMDPTLYGIPNCDSIKKARKWLERRGVNYAFHDYKKAGIDEAKLREWMAEVGWEVLLNKRGTTFRDLPAEMKADVDEDVAVALMKAHPSMIKRPVLESEGPLIVGFKGGEYETALGLEPE
jgi:Spx/MgsR family transcriptional regulator